MEYQKLRSIVHEAALSCARRGAAYSQEKQVFDEVARQFKSDRFSSPPLDIKLQQDILTCWHDLFREGHLSWGVDLDNPGAPFFHVPSREVQLP